MKKTPKTQIVLDDKPTDLVLDERPPVTLDALKHLATEVYGYKNTSEFMRDAIYFVMTQKPTLGRTYAPKEIERV